MEAVLGPDKNFWVGVNYLLKVTKRPLVVTTTQRSTLDSLQESFEEVTFKRPTLVSFIQFSVIPSVSRYSGNLFFTDEIGQAASTYCEKRGTFSVSCTLRRNSQSVQPRYEAVYFDDPVLARTFCISPNGRLFPLHSFTSTSCSPPTSEWFTCHSNPRW